MNNSRLVSNVTAGVVILSILFLPVVGCHGLKMTGVEVLKEPSIDEEIKLGIFAALFCGFLVFIFANPIARALSAIVGGTSSLVAYLIALGQNELIELRIGGILALLGYGLIVIMNILKSKDIEGNLPTSESSP